MSKKYIYMLFIFLIFLISTSIFSSDYFKIEQVKKVYSSKDLKCKYTVSNIIEKKDNYSILIYYPNTLSDKLNKNIHDKIDTYIDKVKGDLATESNNLTIQFDSKEFKNYTSFIFDVTITNNTTHSSKYIFTCNYDNVKNKIITIDDIISNNNESLKNISNYIYKYLKEKDDLEKYISNEDLKEYLDLNKNKYECFYFTKDGIVFCFNADTIVTKNYGIIYVDIPYDEIGI